MATNYPHWEAGSQYSTVTSSSQQFGTALTEGTVYVLSVTTPTWFKVSATGGAASVGANSHFIGAGGFRRISPTGASMFVQIIKDTGAADGRASLSKVVVP